MSRITPFDAKTQVDRLMAAGWTLPSKATVQQLAQAWTEAMGDIDERDLVAAVDDYLRTGHYWPKPADLRVRAAEARKARPREAGQAVPAAEEYWAWESHEHDEEGPLLGAIVHGKPARECSKCEAGCPVCGARYEWQPRLTIVHDEREHDRYGVGFAGYSRAGIEFYAVAERSRQQLARAQRILAAEEEDRQRRAELERQQVARLAVAAVAAELETAGVG